jgi:hypothetical protein
MPSSLAGEDAGAVLTAVREREGTLASRPVAGHPPAAVARLRSATALAAVVADFVDPRHPGLTESRQEVIPSDLKRS